VVGTRTDNFYALYATLDANNVIANTPGDSLLQVNADGFDAFVACLGSSYNAGFDFDGDGRIATTDSTPFGPRFLSTWSLTVSGFAPTI